jgi:O-antigen ligase
MTSSRRRLPVSSKVIFWFVFLGPIGALIPLPGLPPSFRFYYLLLVPGIIIVLAKGIRLRTVGHFLILSPVLVYMMVSAVYAYLAFPVVTEGTEGNPLIRFFLFVCLLLFTMCAGEEVSTFDIHLKLKVLAVFMNGYLISLIVGYIFFIGFYLHIFTLEFLAHFEVLVQLGFGILRFSPGSYPNEYGVVSSFVLSILALLLLYRKQLLYTDRVFQRIRSLPILCFCALLTLGALFLATTRAAYISFLLSVLYVGLSQGGFRKPIVFIARTLLIGAFLILCAEPFFDVAGIFVKGYEAFFSEGNVGNGRLNAWGIALDFFLQQPYLGVGFGAVDMMHNVYLQLLFGLGIVGSCLLVLTILVLLIRARGLILVSSDSIRSAPQLFIQRVSTIGLIHVLWFAMGNHNLNHFLTWFTVLLGYLRIRNSDYGSAGALSPIPLPSSEVA